MMPDIRELCARLTQALEAIQDGDLGFAAAILDGLVIELEAGS
jgi:hypothetical protein